jgi:hypothetical protein
MSLSSPTHSSNCIIMTMNHHMSCHLRPHNQHNTTQHMYTYRAMEQIKRCDIHPDGWFSSAGGADPSSPSSWSCTNTTIDRAGEMPQNCQYSTFWGFPDDMRYAGAAEVNGIACDQWLYHSQGNEHTLYAIMLDEETGEAIPVVSGLLQALVLLV